MVDNVEITAGTGTSIATDDVGGVQHQKVKVEFGVADSATMVSASDPLPTVQTGALPAGTNAIGKLAANSGVDIGDVDVLSLIPGTGATNLGKAEDAQHASGDVGVMVLAVRSDAGGALAGTDGDYAPLSIDASGNLRVNAQVGSSATALGKLEDNAHSSGDLGVMSLGVRTDTPASLCGTTGDYAPFQLDSLGNVRVSISSNTISAGATPYQNLDVDETEDDVKTSPGKVFWIHAMNLATTKRYLKFYNATAANVTVGSTTPVLTLTLPADSGGLGAGFSESFPGGIQFDTAICIAATTGFAVADTGAPGANEVIVNLGFA